MSVFQDFLISLRDYRRYPELLKNGKRRVFAFAAARVQIRSGTSVFPSIPSELTVGGTSGPGEGGSTLFS